MIPRVQAGVFYAEERNADLLFVTLQKTERASHRRPCTATTPSRPTVFHWESQHTAHPETPTGKRYIEGTSQVLAVRA